MAGENLCALHDRLVILPRPVQAHRLPSRGDSSIWSRSALRLTQRQT
jgi:hypothetical protein